MEEKRTKIEAAMTLPNALTAACRAGLSQSQWYLAVGCNCSWFPVHGHTGYRDTSKAGVWYTCIITHR